MRQLLKILALGLFLGLPLVNSLGAGEVIGYIKPNILQPDRLDVVNNLGRSNYYLERDVLNSSRWVIYHRDSNHRAGVIERNPLRLYQHDIKMRRPSGVQIESTTPSFRFKRFGE